MVFGGKVLVFGEKVMVFREKVMVFGGKVMVFGGVTVQGLLRKGWKELSTGKGDGFWGER